MSSDSSQAFFLLPLAFAIGVYFFFRGFRVFRTYRYVADTPEATLRSVAMGFVKVRGKATGTKTVNSPVTHTPSFFYRVDVDLWYGDNSEGRWVRQTTDTGGGVFYLHDHTGKVLIQPQNAEFDLVQTGQQQIMVTSASASAAGSGEAARQAVPSQASVSELELYARAALSRAPTNVLLSGGIQMSPLDSPEEFQRKRKLAVQGGLGFFEQIAKGGNPSHRPGALSGRYQLTEYCIVPEQSYEVSGTCLENPNPTDEHDRNMIVKGRTESTFVISSKGEQGMQQALRTRALLYTIGGAGLALVSMMGMSSAGAQAMKETVIGIAGVAGLFVFFILLAGLLIFPFALRHWKQMKKAPDSRVPPQPGR